MSCPNRLRRLSARSLSAAANRLLRSERAAAVVEMALVLPLFVALAMGILVYGQYFLLAHSVQQAAHDGARAAILGPDAAHRRDIAARAVGRRPDRDAGRAGWRGREYPRG